MHIHIKFRSLDVEFIRSITKKESCFPWPMKEDYKHIYCVVNANNKFIPMLITSLIGCLFSLFRTTYWRLKPSLYIAKEFGSNKQHYKSCVRFSTGKWFGKKYQPKKFDSEVMGFRLTKEK